MTTVTTVTTVTAFQRLIDIMDTLREQCPWDKKQTIQTLRPLTIEETYELADAITESDWKGVKEELGDLFLHLVFYARIGKEQGQFTLDEVLNGICDKLISRHPHIYGPGGSAHLAATSLAAANPVAFDPTAASLAATDSAAASPAPATPASASTAGLTPSTPAYASTPGLVEVKTEEDVKRNWEQLKLREGKRSVLAGVPISLPATIKATRLQEKAGKVGFEWDETTQVWDKVREEMAELQEAVAEGDPTKIEEEFGDLSFSLINYARFLHIDAENALERTNKKFIARFTRMEEEARSRGRSLADMTLAEMDALWDSIKAADRQKRAEPAGSEGQTLPLNKLDSEAVHEKTTNTKD